MITKDGGPNPEGGLSALADFGRKKYKCPKGHEWEAWGDLTYTNYEKVVSDSLCPYCIVEFLNSNFPAKEASGDLD